ncbi:MAG: hypothetical protein Q8R76_08110 [Candidatus Omnitrophota bacterium]|nr:hypothetical protein [Candidatus Omnitrophota bacterium]
MKTHQLIIKSAGLGILVLVATLMTSTGYAASGGTGIEAAAGESAKPWWRFWGQEPGQDETQIRVEEQQELSRQLREERQEHLREQRQDRLE